jgi:hypothetical protein
MQKPSKPTRTVDRGMEPLTRRGAAARRMGRKWSEWYEREDESVARSPFGQSPRRMLLGSVAGAVLAAIAAVASGEFPRPTEVAAIALALGYAGYVVGRPLLKRYHRDRARRVVYERPARRIRSDTT